MADAVLEARRAEAAPWPTLKCVFDDGPAAKAAIGLVTLANDTVIEPELKAFLPDGASVYASRIPIAKMASVKTLVDMEAHLAEAARLIVPEDRLDVLAFGCTSGSMAIGPENVKARINGARPGIPVTNPVSAAAKGLKALGVRRIALITPYPDDVNAVVEKFVSGQGFEIAVKGSFKCKGDFEISRVPPQALYEAAVELGRKDVGGVFISCTALRCSSMIQRAEDAIGKPIVTSNQALAWDCLRLAGDERPVAGFGRLLGA